MPTEKIVRESKDLDPMKYTKLVALEQFHQHREACWHCQQAPFDLCAQGMIHLRHAATGKKES